MRAFQDVRLLPPVPAVYVFFSRESNGRGHSSYPVYVGLTGNLYDRIVQHLWKRDSSVTTGTAAVTLNPDYLTELHWWESPRFADKITLAAAEEIAFKKFEPVLRDRGRVRKEARALLKEPAFHSYITTLLEGPPSGVLAFCSLEELVPRVEALEKQVADLVKEVAALRDPG